MSLRLNKNLDVSVESTNLTHAPNDLFTSRARNSAVVYNVTGRGFMIGARRKF